MRRSALKAPLLMILIFTIIGEATASSAPAAPLVATRQVTFSLIIGVNRNLNADRPDLRFADDDAFQNRQLMAQLTGPQNIILLTTPDKETAPLVNGINRERPTREALEDAMRRLNAQMRAVKQAGRQPVFYLFYTGHGDVKNNEGYVALDDGRLTRSDLMTLLKGSEASLNHVVIDACKSYFMVFNRGAGGTRRPVAGSFVSTEKPLPRNTGFFLSTSSGADSHEWELFQGGIFSHEMRSALRGGADFDGDRTITYEEAAAFIWQANEAIPVPRFRPRFFVHPPGNDPAESSVLADLNRARGGWLSLGLSRPEHQYLEDGLGRRLLDLHPAPDRDVAVLIPDRRPLFVRFPQTGEEISLPAGDAIDISETRGTPLTVTSRGAEHEAFVRLFSLPFGRETIAEYREWQQLSAKESVSMDSPDKPWLRRSFGIGALVLGAAGATFTSVAIANRRQDGDANGDDVAATNDRIKALNIAAITCYGIAGAALATYVIWRLVPTRKRVTVSLSPSPDALFIRGTF